MKCFLKISILMIITALMAQSASGYDPSKHQKNSGVKQGGGKGKHHGYGRPKGPPADIPAHIKERTSPDGRGINLNNSQVGVEGITIISEFGSKLCISADIVTGRKGLESGCISSTRHAILSKSAHRS